MSLKHKMTIQEIAEEAEDEQPSESIMEGLGMEEEEGYREDPEDL